MTRISAPLFMLALLLPVRANAQTPCTVDGQSYMVLVKGTGLVGVDDYFNLTSVPDGGGAGASTLVDTAALPIPLPLPVSGKLVSNSASGDSSSCSASSFSSVADLNVDVLGLVTISADLVEAATSVKGGGCDASTKIVGLQIAALGIPVTIPDPLPANTTIPLGPLGSVTLKEENCSGSDATAAVIHAIVNVGLPPLVGETIDVEISRARSVASSSAATGASTTPSLLSTLGL